MTRLENQIKTANDLFVTYCMTAVKNNDFDAKEAEKYVQLIEYFQYLKESEEARSKLRLENIISMSGNSEQINEIITTSSKLQTKIKALRNILESAYSNFKHDDYVLSPVLYDPETFNPMLKLGEKTNPGLEWKYELKFHEIK